MKDGRYWSHTSTKKPRRKCDKNLLQMEEEKYKKQQERQLQIFLCTQNDRNQY